MIGDQTVVADSAPVKGLLCFYNERVDLKIDGQPLEQVVTKFS